MKLIDLIETIDFATRIEVKIFFNPTRIFSKDIWEGTAREVYVNSWDEVDEPVDILKPLMLREVQHIEHDTHSIKIYI